jgi:hypothetical protein
MARLHYSCFLTAIFRNCVHYTFNYTALDILPISCYSINPDLVRRLLFFFLSAALVTRMGIQSPAWTSATVPHWVCRARLSVWLTLSKQRASHRSLPILFLGLLPFDVTNGTPPTHRKRKGIPGFGSSCRRGVGESPGAQPWQLVHSW